MFLPPGFDISIAREAAQLVVQAYDQFAAFKSKTAWSLQGNYNNLQTLHARPEGLFAELEPFGFVAQNKASGNQFLTFRGTDSPEDWISNATINHTAHPWGPVEDGFSKLYAQCSADVIAAVKSAPGTPTIFVTGHSLGAALSTLATADVFIHGLSAQLYNFASPRTGSPDFAAQFNQKVAVAWRTVNTEDIVTTIPIATPTLASGKPSHGLFGILIGLAPKLNFEHVGSPVNFTTFNGSILGNHQMATYVAALSAAKAAAV
jgi:triacylglycerol lipase